MSGVVDRLLRQLGQKDPPPDRYPSTVTTGARQTIAGSSVAAGGAARPRPAVAGAGSAGAPRFAGPPEHAGRSAAVGARARGALPGRAGRDSAPRGGPLSLPTPPGVWLRVGLVGALVVGLTQWPYGDCGGPLVGYLGAVGVSLVAGVWAARKSWRRRMGWAHTVAIVLVLAASALAALQVLPRFGYAPEPVTWGCSVYPHP